MRTRIHDVITMATLVILSFLMVIPFMQVSAAPKTVTGHKVNLGWPNFFNPEIAILRKNEKKSKFKEIDDDVITEEDNNSNDEEEENSSTEEDDILNLLDYTIKGGLRGRLFMINSTSCSDYIPDDIIEDIHDILEEEEVEDRDVLAETLKDRSDTEHRNDSECYKGEVTENGIRLRTPLVSRQYSPALGKFGALISVPAVSYPVTFVHYGNWCGRGGRSAPIDHIDRCCLDHDKCYGRLVQDCPDIWSRPYNVMYAWSLLEELAVCVRSESLCINNVCKCDREAALCFLEGLRLQRNHLNSTATPLTDDLLITDATYVEELATEDSALEDDGHVEEFEPASIIDIEAIPEETE